MVATRDATREPSLSPSLDGEPHGRGHLLRVVGARDGESSRTASQPSSIADAASEADDPGTAVAELTRRLDELN